MVNPAKDGMLDASRGVVAHPLSARIPQHQDGNTKERLSTSETPVPDKTMEDIFKRGHSMLKTALFNQTATKQHNVAAGSSSTVPEPSCTQFSNIKDPEKRRALINLSRILKEILSEQAEAKGERSETESIPEATGTQEEANEQISNSRPAVDVRHDSSEAAKSAKRQQQLAQLAKARAAKVAKAAEAAKASKVSKGARRTL
jgi:hypothetical protein